MGTVKQKVVWDVGFQVHQQDLNKLKKSLQQLFNITRDQKKLKIFDPQATDKDAKLIKDQIISVQDAIQKAFNPKLNTINLTTFKKQLSDAGHSLNSIYDSWTSKGPAGQRAFRDLTTEILKTNVQLRQSHTLIDKMATTLSNTLRWTVASSAVRAFTTSVQRAWGFTKELDTSLNDIRIVTGKSANEMEKFAQQANKAAQSLGTTTTDYTQAALIYAQQGLSDAEVAERAKITLKAANVTGQSTDAVSEQLTAIWNGYKVTAQEAEVYIDRVAAVAATTASDLEELSIGMSRVAAAAANMGVQEDQLAAMISTMVSATREAPETIGTSLRTVFARISDIKAGIDEQGTTLGMYSQRMADLGFNVLTANGQLRDMGDILEEIGGKWETLTREQQIYLTQTMAGQRQYSRLIALFDNFEKYTQSLDVARNATGTLQQQQETYMDSTKAHLKELRATLESFWMELADSGSINTILDAVTVLAAGIANIFKSLGGGIPILKSISALMLDVFATQISKSIQISMDNAARSKQQMQQMAETIKQAENILQKQGLDAATQKVVSSFQKLNSVSRFLSKEQFQGVQNLIDQYSKLAGQIDDIGTKEKILTNQLSKEFKQLNIQANDLINGSTSVSQVQELLNKRRTATDLKDITLPTYNEQEVREAIQANKDYLLAKEEFNEKQKTINQINKEILKEEQDKIKIKASIQEYEVRVQNEKKLNKAKNILEDEKNILKQQQVALKNSNLQQDLAKHQKKLNSQKQKIVEEKEKIQKYEAIVQERPDDKRYEQWLNKAKVRLQEAEDNAKKEQDIIKNLKAPLLEQQEKINKIKEKIVKQQEKVDKLKTEVQKKGNQNSKELLKQAKQNLKEKEKLLQEEQAKLEQFESELGQLNSNLGSAQVNLIQKLNQVNLGRGKTKDFLSNIKGNLKSVFDPKGSEYQALYDSFNKLQEIVRKPFSAEQLEKKGPQFKQALENFTNQVKTNLGKIDNLSEAQYQKLSKLLNDFTSSGGAQASQKLQQELQRLGTKIDEVGERYRKAFSIQNFTKTISGIGQLSSGMNQIVSLAQTWRDDSTDFLEDLTTSITNLGFTLPMIIKAFSSLKTAIGGGWTAVIGIGLAAINIIKQVAKAREQAEKQRIEELQKNIQAEQQKQEQLKNNKKLYDSLDEINQKYKEGAITRLDLKNQIDDLCEQYKLENDAVKDLTTDYNNLTDAIKQQRIENAKEIASSKKKQAENKRQLLAKEAKKSNVETEYNPYLFAVSNFNNFYGDKLHLKSLEELTGTESSNDIIKYYHDINDQMIKISEAIRNEELELDDIALETLRSVFSYYSQITSKLRPTITQIESLEKEAADAESSIGIETRFNDSQIKDLQSYINQYNKAKTDVSQQTTKKYLKENYSNLYNQYQQAADFYLNLGGTQNKELDERIKNDVDYLLKLQNIGVSNWEQLKDIVEYLDSVNLEKLAPPEDFSQQISSAAEQYKTYFNLSQVLQVDEWSKLDQRIQSFYTVAADGTMKMAGSIEKFRQAITEFTYGGFATNIDNIYNSLDRLENNLQDFQLHTLNFTLPSEAKVDFTKNDVVQDSLDFLTEFGNLAAEKREDLVSKLKLGSKETLEYIEEQVRQTYSNIGKYEEAFEEKRKQHESALFSNFYSIASSFTTFDDLYRSLERLPERYKDNEMAVAAYTKAAIELNKALDLQNVDQEELEALKDYLQDNADVIDEINDNLDEVQGNAEILAKSIIKMNQGLEELSSNWETWQEVLQRNERYTSENSQAFLKTRDALANLLDISKDYISYNFITQNMDAITRASQGSTEAIDELKNSLKDEVLIKITNNKDDLIKNFEDIIAEIPDITLEVGSEFNETAFLEGFNDLASRAGWTAEQINAALDTIGYEPVFMEAGQTLQNTTPVVQQEPEETEGLAGGKTRLPWGTEWEWGPVPGIKTTTKVTEEPTESQITIPAFNNKKKGTPKIEKIIKKASSSFANKSIGQDKTKSSKPSKKDTKKGIKDDRDIYHDINIQIKQITRQLTRAQKVQGRLFGKELLDNLNKQTAILELQKKKLVEKQAIQKQDLANQQQNLKNLGVTFDEYGNIGNYMSILLQKQNEVNAATASYNTLINEYNAQANKDSQEAMQDLIDESSKSLEKVTEEYKELQDAIKNYDSLQQDMRDLEDQIEEAIQKQIEINISKFKMEIQLRLDVASFTRDYNQFVRDVINHTNLLKDSNFDSIVKDAKKSFDDLYTYVPKNGIGTIQALMNQIVKTKAEIEQIDKNGRSLIYGDNKKQAIADLEEYTRQLMSQMTSVEELIDSINQSYLDIFEDINDQFATQIENYKYVGELLEHDVNLLKLLYGEKNYAAMDSYYSQIEKNNNKQLDSLKQQAEFWKEKWDAAAAAGDTNAAKQFEENYKQTITNINSLVESAVKNLQDKYANAIDQIFDELDKKLTNGKGMDYLSKRWESIKEMDEFYLDDINSESSLQGLEKKFNKAKDATTSLQGQRKINELMQQQMKFLREKDKLTKYDIERAEKRLEILKAQIALEDAQAAKYTMRLKRDTQGNYSYEYVADENAIKNAQDKLDAAQLDLYNSDKENQKKLTDQAFSKTIEMKNEIQEVYKDATLSEEERQEKIKEIEQRYQPILQALEAEGLVAQQYLRQSAFEAYANLYNEDLEKYKNMTDEEARIALEELVPTWDTAAHDMLAAFVGTDDEAGTFPLIQEAIQQCEDKNVEYQKSLEDLEKNAGISLDNLRQGVDNVANSMAGNIVANDILMQKMTEEAGAAEGLKSKLAELTTQYQNSKTAAEELVTTTTAFIQSQYNAAIAAAEAAKYVDAYTLAVANAPRIDNPAQFFSNDGNGSGSGNGAGGTDKPGKSALPSWDPTSYVFSTNTTDRSVDDDQMRNQAIQRARTDQWYQDNNRSVNDSVERNNYLQRIKFDTGGYTGTWSDLNGRLAFLHQKELVLNQEDTRNFLNAVKLLRSIKDSLQGNIYSAMSQANLAMRQYNSAIAYAQFEDAARRYEQAVHIEANFPNVNSKQQIEEALSDLVNLAAQRALKNY